MPGSDVQSGRWFREGRTLVLHGVGPAAGFVDEVLGEVGGAVKTAPAPIKLAHYHVRKVPNASGALVAASAATVMTPAAMRPGYVLPTDPRRRALQAALTNLLRTKYAAAIAPPVNLRVALVDMTGAKRNAPVFAGHRAFGPGANLEAGSLAKILALYALYQLRFDLNTCAARLGITKAAALQTRINAEWTKQGLRTLPKLPVLFSFIESPGKTVRVKLTRVPWVHDDDDPRWIIVNVGFEYIGSVALQSGLFDETQGGLWLNAAYQTPAVTWTATPFPKLERHNVTALAAATFFTLLAQGRLASEAMSTKIGDILSSIVCMDNGVVEGIQALGGVQDTPENKCGIVGPFLHDAFHLIRQASAGRRVEYAAAVLTKHPPKIKLRALGRDLDALIVAANP
jgi:hypothetical protein